MATTANHKTTKKYAKEKKKTGSVPKREGSDRRQNTPQTDLRNTHQAPMDERGWLVESRENEKKEKNNRRTGTWARKKAHNFLTVRSLEGRQKKKKLIQKKNPWEQKGRRRQKRELFPSNCKPAAVDGRRHREKRGKHLKNLMCRNGPRPSATK